MLKRKIEQKLIDWKNTENRKPLIIKGCRQCGKTFSVLDFAKKNYKNVENANKNNININRQEAYPANPYISSVR